MNILVAGLGQQGNYFIKALKKLAVPECNIFGHDVDLAKIDEAKQKFPGISVCRDLIHDDGYDPYTRDCENEIRAMEFAIVATSTPNHHRMIIELAGFGIKYILCEKPLGMNLVEVNEVKKVIDETGTNVFTAFQMNFSPAVMHIIKMMQDKGLILTEGSVVWGKNRKGDKRPTPGDLEDELVHGKGILNQLIHINQVVRGSCVSGMLTYPKFTDSLSQGKAHELDTSFPLRVNASSMVLECIKTDRAEVACVMHSSFLYSHQVRRVSLVLSMKDDPLSPVYSVEMDFDVKTGIGGYEDQITITQLDGNKVEFLPFSSDKILDQTQAFIKVPTGVIDPRLTQFEDAERAVAFSEAVFRSHSERS